MFKVIISESTVYIDIVEKVVNIAILCLPINCTTDTLITAGLCTFHA